MSDEPEQYVILDRGMVAEAPPGTVIFNLDDLVRTDISRDEVLTIRDSASAAGAGLVVHECDQWLEKHPVTFRVEVQFDVTTPTDDPDEVRKIIDDLVEKWLTPVLPVGVDWSILEDAVTEIPE